MEGQKAVICFFTLFMTVYFLEAIGGFYMTSAVVSIEKQFQIPSRMSGLMVSAGDFGYIPSVVFVSYIGGKGNRARWIGGGCILIAVANLLISSSNFMFPVEQVKLSSAHIEHQIEMNPERITDEISVNSFLHYLQKTNSTRNYTNVIDDKLASYSDLSMKQYALKHLNTCLDTGHESADICDVYSDYMHEMNTPNATEISNIRILMGASFGLCSQLVKGLRDQIHSVKCSRNPSNMGPFILIFGGLLILGVGRTMPFSLGLPLLDDNVKRVNLPLYFAGMFFIRILGPVLGFVIGGITNKYYYSFEVPPGLSPRDPMWIGRWWIGFMGIGTVMLGPSIALFLFPDPKKKSNKRNNVDDSNETAEQIKLEPQNGNETEPFKKPTRKRNRSLALVDRNVERDEDGKLVLPKSFKGKFKDFSATVRTIIKCPVYMGALVGRVIDVMAFKGFFVFLPKYLEVQFGIPQHTINIFMGVVGVSGFALGVMIGCGIMRLFKLQGRRAAAFVALCSTMAAILSFLNSTVKCKSVLSFLADQQFEQNGVFNSTCSSQCNCDGLPMYPVCNRDGQTFFSPCHAGCPLNETLADDSTNKFFYNCLCSNTTDMVVSRDFCDEGTCKSQFILYFVNMAISGVFGGLGVVPAILIILRSVPPVDRSVSLGFQGFCVSLLATLPSPIVWGFIVDSACIRWNRTCGDLTRGACSIYNSDALRLRTHITYGVMRLVSLISDAWVFYYAKDLRLTDEDPDPIVNEAAAEGVIDKDRKFSL